MLEISDPARREAGPSCASPLLGGEAGGGVGSPELSAMDPFSTERTAASHARSSSGVGGVQRVRWRRRADPGVPTKGRGATTAQFRSNGDSRSRMCSIARPPAQRTPRASASVRRPRSTASASSCSSFQPYVSRAGGIASSRNQSRVLERSAVVAQRRLDVHVVPLEHPVGAPGQQHRVGRLRERERQDRTVALLCPRRQSSSRKRTSPMDRGDQPESGARRRKRDGDAARPRPCAPPARRWAAPARSRGA